MDKKFCSGWFCHDKMVKLYTVRLPLVHLTGIRNALCELCWGWLVWGIESQYSKALPPPQRCACGPLHQQTQSVQCRSLCLPCGFLQCTSWLLPSCLTQLAPGSCSFALHPPTNSYFKHQPIFTYSVSIALTPHSLWEHPMGWTRQKHLHLPLFLLDLALSH